MNRQHLESADETRQNIGPPLEGVPNYSLPESRLLVVLLVVVCVAVLVVHWPALSAEAFSFDDGQYLSGNLLVQNPSWASVRRFLVEVLNPSTVDGYYQPLAMISLMTDYALGGRADNLMPFHRTSLTLHVANTALIIVLLYMLFGQVWLAAAAGLLFGVHPMTVEPIPWIGERKTLLAAFFAMWCLIFYVRFTRKSDWKFYVSCFVTYVLALMSKPTSLPLPALMLLMDYWPLNRLGWKRIVEKLPLFIIGGVFAAITYISQSRTAFTILPSQYHAGYVPLILCHNIIFYLYKIIWPVNLSSYYPFPVPLGLSNPTVLAYVIGGCILIALLVTSLRWTKVLLTGWLFFLMAILPTMQIVRFSHVIASDKFVYLPSVGLLMILAWFLGRLSLVGGGVLRRAVIIIVVILTGVESFATRHYLSRWRDTVTLYEYMLTLAPKAPSLHDSLGCALQSQGRFEEAISHHRMALEGKLADTSAYNNMGAAFLSQGKSEQAIECFRQALQLKPENPEVFNNLGLALQSQGRLDEAVSCYRETIKLNPERIDVYYNLGNTLQLQGKLDEAISNYRQALRLVPKDAEVHNKLGIALQSQGKLDEAISQYHYALQIKPEYAEAHNNLGAALGLKGRLDEAISQFRLALHFRPDYANAHNNLGHALLMRGELNEAIEHFRQTLRAKPDQLSSLNDLAWILAKHPDLKMRNAAEAVTLAEHAASLTKYQDASTLSILATAYSAAGQLQPAITTAQKALDIASAGDNKVLVTQIREQLERYKQAKH